MDPPGCNSEPAELDHTLLDFDPDSLLDAWVEDLLTAGDHSAQQDDRPAAMPPDNIFSNMDSSFGGSESALATGFGMTQWTESIGYIAAYDYIADPLDRFQASEMPQDCVTGLGPSTTNLARVDGFSMSNSSMLQQLYPMDFQFSAGGGHNPPPREVANVWSIQPIESSDFTTRTHDSRTTHHIEHFEGQIANAPGVSQHAAPTAFTPLSIYPQGLGPDILTRRQLPPKRRGGRRGKLSPEQARQQRETRISGACIRCRRYNLGCGGGIPCAPCLKILGKSRIWTTPCTKAQFLDIIEAGSSFPSVTMQEITLFKSPDIRSMMVLMVRITHILQQKADQCVVIQSLPLGQICMIPWAIGGLALLSIFADLSQDPCDWKRPSFSKVASKLTDLVKDDPSGELVTLFTKTEELYTPEWTGSVMAFCLSSSYQQPTEYTCDDALPQPPGHDTGSLTSRLVFWTGWVASRYLELCLFRHLQLVSNDTSFGSVEDQKSYIMCILTVLLASNSYPQSIHKDSMDEEDSRLRGLVSMLTAASTTEQENAAAIQDEIQTMVTAAFGTRSSVEEALLNSWAQQDDFQRALIEFLRPEAATIPLDMRVVMSLCLLGKLSIKASGKPSTCIDFEMKEDVCREAESIMERDCSALDSESRRELRIWSHKVLDFARGWFPVDTGSQASS